MKKRVLGLLLGAGAMCCIALPVVADTTPEDAKDYRAAVMTAFRGHIGAASMIVRGLVANDGQLLGHAEGLASSAAELKNLFPEGSDVGESEAPSQRSGVIRTSLLPRSMRPSRRRQSLRKRRPAAIRKRLALRFREVGMSCRGCHDDFRRSD